MEVKLYQDFSKRSNSNLAPTTGYVYITKNLTLKEKCDILKPSFFLADTVKYTYCEAFGWYYFITNTAYDINGAQYIECKLDPLATWRDEINLQSAFVKYSTSKYNEFLRDERIVTGGKMVSASIHLPLSEYISQNETYMWLLTTFVADPDDYTNNGIMCYLFTNAEWLYFIQEIVSNGESFFGSINQSFTDLKNAFIDISCIPFANAESMGAVCNDVIVGTYHTHCSAHYASHEAIIINDGMPLTSLNRSDFRILEPYTYAKLFLPFVGVVDFSCEELQNAGSLFFSIYANILTRKITYIVYVGSGNLENANAKILGIYHGTFGIQIPLAYLYNDNAQGFIQSSITAAGGLATMAGGVVSGNPIVVGAGAASALAAEASAFMKANSKNISMHGGLSGNYGWSACQSIKLEVFTPEVSEDPANLAQLYGRPLLQVEQIGNLTGYCETVGFSFNGNVIDSVRDMINTAMDSGVYLE